LCVTRAKAGIHLISNAVEPVDARLRGHDEQ